MLSIIRLRAQKLVQESFEPLTDVHVISTRWDLSKADIDGQIFENFIDLKSYKGGSDYHDEFEKDIREILDDFIDEFNDTNNPIALISSQTE